MSAFVAFDVFLHTRSLIFHTCHSVAELVAKNWADHTAKQMLIAGFFWAHELTVIYKQTLQSWAGHGPCSPAVAPLLLSLLDNFHLCLFPHQKDLHCIVNFYMFFSTRSLIFIPATTPQLSPISLSNEKQFHAIVDFYMFLHTSSIFHNCHYSTTSTYFSTPNRSSDTSCIFLACRIHM